MTTFQEADGEVLDRLARQMDLHHRPLADAGVRVGVLLAHNPDGPAVRHAGYAALASIKVVSLRDRVTKRYDAELLIDESEWRGMRDRHRDALLDHELSHLALAEHTYVGADEGDPAGEPTIRFKRDDLGRPRLKLVKGDWNAGDGFRAVVERHGEYAAEYLNISRAKALADAARRGEC